jgi:cytochrome c-type biogenesis protein CcmH/NrfF
MAGPEATSFGKRARPTAPRPLSEVERDYQIMEEPRHSKPIWLMDRNNHWTILWGFCGVLVVLIVTIIAIGFTDQANRTPEEIAKSEMQDAARAVQKFAEARTASCRKDRRVEVFTLVQTQIRNSVRSPSTASFNIAESDIRLAEDCLWKIRSFVDSQNGFGAIVRTPWSATVEFIPETQGWKLRKIDLG